MGAAPAAKAKVYALNEKTYLVINFLKPVLDNFAFVSFMTASDIRRPSNGKSSPERSLSLIHYSNNSKPRNRDNKHLATTMKIQVILADTQNALYRSDTTFHPR